MEHHIPNPQMEKDVGMKDIGNTGDLETGRTLWGSTFGDVVYADGKSTSGASAKV